MKSIVRSISLAWEERPLSIIMGLALFFRLLAAVFAKGYGMHDDHFCVIDYAQQWLKGTLSVIDKGDNIRSLLYPGLHYVLFYILEKMGMFDPQTKMYVVRFLHALYSMLTVYFGYKTALLLTNRTAARSVGLLLAVFWLFPFMAVRNLIEFVCVPPMVIGMYLLVLNESNAKNRFLFLAGALLGLAFTLRFQTIAFAGTAGLVYCIRKQWASAAWYAFGWGVSSFIAQTISDVLLAHTYPYASFVNACYLFTVHDPNAYPVGPWYQYIGLLIGVLIPPMSFLLLYGFLTTWKKHSLIFWPTMAFLTIHSLIMNKQERFILPIVPFILLLSVIGWEELSEKSRLWLAHKKVVRWSWRWFWCINAVLLCVCSMTYSKKSRVETLTYLSHKSDVRGVLIETTDKSPPLAPLFYLNKNVPVYYLPSTKKIEILKAEIDSAGSAWPNYVILLDQSSIAGRLKKLQGLFHDLRFEKCIVPSFIDHLLYMMNPKHNVNQSSSIYKSE